MAANHDSYVGFTNCRKQILAALIDEMNNRHTISDLSWVYNERAAVATAANQWIKDHGSEIPNVASTITANDVEAVEGLAVGHVDYASKLALYVAELVYGYKPKP